MTGAGNVGNRQLSAACQPEAVVIWPVQNQAV